MKQKILIWAIILCLFATNYCAQASTKYKIYVDTGKCVVKIYKSDGTFVGQQKCCPGRKGKTPKGNMTILKKKSCFRHDDAKYNYVSYFSNKCAFHSTPYINGKYDNSSLGHHKSGGCIRLSPEAAKWIYKHCSVGTEVYIK